MSITIENLQVDDLHANPHNPRKQVGDVEELASSIRSQGIKQPLLVTPTGETDIGGHKQYRVVIGHRRLAAARQAGLSTVPAIVEEMDARREREIMLVENTQRSDLTPVEEADGYQGLLDLGVRVKEMAEKTGRSDRFVRRRLRIARIPQETRDMSADFSQLSLDQLDKLAEFESDPDMQRELARSTDFEWTYRRLVSERDKTKWCGEADKALAKAGVRVESFPDGKNYWTFEPRGYRRRTVISSTRDPFWKQFTGEDGWPEFCVFKNHGDYCLYEPIPLDQLEWAESAKAERQAIMARGRNSTARLGTSRRLRGTRVSHGCEPTSTRSPANRQWRESANSRSLRRLAGIRCSWASASMARVSWRRSSVLDGICRLLSMTATTGRWNARRTSTRSAWC